MTLAAVADTGPLIHLAEVDALSLLSTIDDLSVPKIVHDELTVGGVPNELGDVEYALVDVTVDERETDRLDPGETAALAIAAERDAVLLTDDLAAREAAAEAGIEVHGSIGVIALGHARRRLDRDEAAALMRALQRETSLFVTDAVIERGIEMLDEQS
ncbi:nucleic acid-binding protein [Halococcus agarilyticus]|uniref:nucleic acid-binding protein n=1 Tax=Halococcus agarilyticus TaxID=1232219 RepID=UPI0006778027|nr:nucleic acid-binding protein [Halococcus agarilyticus]